MSAQNIRSLPAHHEDLLLQPHLKECDVICLTETWLTHTHPSGIFAIHGYQLLRQDRNHAAGGGLCCYVKSSITCSEGPPLLQCAHTEVQSLILQPPKKPEFLLIIVYRRPSASRSIFSGYFCLLLKELIRQQKTIVIVGDLNFDLLTSIHSPEVQSVLDTAKIKQHVKKPTHRTGSLLDHVYTNNHVTVHQNASLYSDHDMIWICYWTDILSHCIITFKYEANVPWMVIERWTFLTTLANS